MPTERPRSLAEDLRARDDAAIVRLLEARADLLSPVPSDLASLAARATTRASAQRALDQLDLFSLQVVDVLCVLPEPVGVGEVERVLGADPSEVLATLRDQALLYGPPEALVVVRTVREVVGPPAGLGPAAESALHAYGPARLEQLLVDLGLPASGDPAEAARRAAGLLADPAALDSLLGQAPPAAREAVDSLTWGPPTGRLERARRPVDAASARSPVEWLLARGVLVAADGETVVLPREVGLHLRGGRVHAAVAPRPPAPEATPRDQALVDGTAAGAAFAVVRLVEDLLELWAGEPPKLLRAGGLGVRDRGRSAAALDVDETSLSLLAETAWAAGLVSVGGDLDEEWLPTPAYDEWLARDIAERWHRLAEAWLATTRVPSLAGGKDVRGRTLSTLGPDLDRGAAPQVRRAVLETLATVPGAAPSAAAVRELLRWHAPRRGGRLRDDMVGWTLREAELLGVVGRGAISTPGLALLAGDAGLARRVLEERLPKPLDHILLQADLTAVAPGPLTSDLAHRLRLVADVESTGGATVYRFSAGSVRRSLDAGWSARDVLELLTTHSRTPVPQPLRYLVEDVARRHGRIRVGTASSYLRCDDEATLDEILADRRTEVLRLRRLGPTALVAQAPADLVLSRLRELGHAPAAEGQDGTLVLRRPDARRAAARRPPPRVVTEPAVPSATLLEAAVRALRAGDRALAAAPKAETAGTTVRLTSKPAADILATLTEAVHAGQPLWIGYVNADGRASQRVVEPISVEGGYVSAFDHLRDEVRTFAVHRITGVAPIDSP